MASKAAQKAGNATMAHSEVREWVAYACECNNCPKLIGKIRVEWSNKLTRTMGICRQPGRVPYWRITLSAPIFARATTEERYNTIVHETCHAVEGFLFGYVDPQLEGHGPKWRNAMRCCGIEPTRYHHVNTDGLRTRHAYVCPHCRKIFKLSTRLHNQVKRGRHRLCPDCRVRVEYTGRSGKGV